MNQTCFTHAVDGQANKVRLSTQDRRDELHLGLYLIEFMFHQVLALTPAQFLF